ncbi:MAG: hypothetical protein AAF413_01155 [Patescibacteria group bacterium]
MSNKSGLGIQAKRVSSFVQALVLASAGLLPLLASSSVDAAQITDRVLTLSTSEGDATGVTHDYGLTIPGDASTMQSMEFLYCTTPLGTCTAPTGLDASSAAIGTPTGLTGWSVGTNTANLIQVTRTDATNVAADTPMTIDFTGVTNPTMTAPYTTFYVRVNTYTDTAYTTDRDNGTVAGALTQQLIINGRVQERLEFCVAAIDDGDTFASGEDCSNFPTNQTIDIGVIDDAGPAESPVDNDGFNGANDKLGAAMVDTNASGGVVISYFPEEDATGTEQLRNFRVLGSTCDATETVVTDQCFQSAATAGTDLSSAGERFGMQVTCVERTASENATANLLNNVAAYQADNSDATCEAGETSTTYAWDNTGTATTIASSTTVVNDEMLKLRFGARAAATTPTGNYTVTTTYIATATF